MDLLLVHIARWLHNNRVAGIVERSIALSLSLKVSPFLLLELHSTLALLCNVGRINFGVSVLVLHKGLALEVLVALGALLTLFLREALHELVHQLSWVSGLGLLATTATTCSVVADLL